MVQCETCKKRITAGSTEHFVCSRGISVRSPSTLSAADWAVVCILTMLFGPFVFLLGVLLLAACSGRGEFKCCGCAQADNRCDQCESRAAHVALRKAAQYATALQGESESGGTQKIAYYYDYRSNYYLDH
mmetsp:Transcript_15988/g.31618  ORF Transcript_15988/g.31618 Transcript_15988/m.31618 type:complete len:130 (-) Transcript_15988:117-506(-)